MASVNSAQDVIGQLSAKSVAAETKKAVNAEDFIKLMLAQFQNQDPMNPMDNAQMVSQLAQISTVDGVNQLNASMASLSSSYAANVALQSSLLVGRSAQIDSKQLTLASAGSAAGSVVVPGSMSNITLNIQNSAGQTVRQIALGSASANTAFTWDGLQSDGSRAPAGAYTLSATGVSNGNTIGLTTAVNYKINSVSYSKQNNQIMLGLDNYAQQVPFSDVVTITGS